MEQVLPHDVIEYHILERLDVKTLLKFKSVSKQWISTIQSPCFQKRQLIHHRSQSGGGDSHVLLVSVLDSNEKINKDIEALSTLVVGSSVSSKIPTPWENKLYDVCNTSCDGLICLYHIWLYNSAGLGLNDKPTTCEVFDFASNAWSYLVPSSPHLILHTQDPVYVDGSFHWFTALSHEGETMILSLDLHTETFQVISKAPFLNVSDEYTIVMCNLEDRLCVSEEEWPNQVIWSLDDSNHKTWKQIYSIDLNITATLFPNHMWLALTPLVVFDKDKLLFYDPEFGGASALVIHDPKTKAYDPAYTSKLSAYFVCYFPSLISIL
ncbi:unnamed protein product [Arabidopsis halleri]